MARKLTQSKAESAKTFKNPAPKRAIDDNYVAPRKRKTAEKHVTLAEALAEQAAEDGKTVEEVQEELTDTSIPAESDRPTRAVGTSNLANTIRNRRKGYTVMLRGDKKTQNCGDQVAELLLAIPLATLQAFSASRFEGKTYEHLNPGHARMCIGNLIRAAAKKDETIVPWLLDNQPKGEAE